MLCHNRASEVKSLIGNKYEYWVSQEGLLLLGRWAAEGLPEARIAEKVGVRPDTLRGWKKRFPQLRRALEQAAPPVDRDRQIENALLKKATGYTVDVSKAYKLRRVEYEDGKKVCEFEELAQGVDQVHVPADLSAQIFWLKNRMPEKWQDKPDAGRLSLMKLDEALGEFKNGIEQETE